jgi:hypothetical protein
MSVIQKFLPEHDLDYDIWPEAKKRFEARKKSSSTQVDDYDEFSDPDDSIKKLPKSQQLS